MRRLVDRRFFTVWVGYGVPPFFFGSAIVAARGGAAMFALHLLMLIAWTVETAMTTCRRCPFYGTGHCGLPGRVIPHLFRRLPASSVTTQRIRIHLWVDFAMIAYMNALYVTLCPTLAPFVTIGSAVTLVIVYRAKRFHGLLYRLRRDREAFHLPVINA